MACEFSGTVRDAFARLGHDAWSCDLLPSEKPGLHVQGDVLGILDDGWDLLIAHPPCTDLAVSGARHFAAKIADGRQRRALDFVAALMGARVPRIAVENPVSVISSAIRRPDQVVQPWQFGHGETKATCWWLKCLPRLVPTHAEGGDLFAMCAPVERVARIHFMPPGPDRWKDRSRTYEGIANAMAVQWGC